MSSQQVALREAVCCGRHRRFPLRQHRSQIALVAQDDSLLQGDDMERMPMGYECLVVDMSTLKLC